MKREERAIEEAFELPVFKNNRHQSMIVNHHELGGVYLRLVGKRADRSHNIFKVNIVINWIKYEVEQITRDAASFLAKTIADLTIIDAVDEQ
jgi:hypothetical protein